MTSTDTPKGLRRFGFIAGGGLLMIGLISWARGHLVAPAILGGVGGSILLVGVAAPRTLGVVEYWWMRAAAVLGHINAQVILTILFYGLVTPIGAILRRVRDPLDRSLDDGQSSNWVRRAVEPVDPARYRQQF